MQPPGDTDWRERAALPVSSRQAITTLTLVGGTGRIPGASPVAGGSAVLGEGNGLRSCSHRRIAMSSLRFVHWLQGR